MSYWCYVDAHALFLGAAASASVGLMGRKRKGVLPGRLGSPIYNFHKAFLIIGSPGILIGRNYLPVGRFATGDPRREIVNNMQPRSPNNGPWKHARQKQPVARPCAVSLQVLNVRLLNFDEKCSANYRLQSVHSFWRVSTCMLSTA